MAKYILQDRDEIARGHCTSLGCHIFLIVLGLRGWIEAHFVSHRSNRRRLQNYMVVAVALAPSAVGIYLLKKIVKLFISFIAGLCLT